MANCIVKILELRSGATAIAAVDPGIITVDPLDTIEYVNETLQDAILLIAQAGILVGVNPGQGVPISPCRGGAGRRFTVDGAAASGTYEYQMLVTLGSGKRMFAIGASTPRIIIRPMTETA